MLPVNEYVTNLPPQRASLTPTALLVTSQFTVMEAVTGITRKNIWALNSLEHKLQLVQQNTHAHRLRMIRSLFELQATRPRLWQSAVVVVRILSRGDFFEDDEVGYHGRSFFVLIHRYKNCKYIWRLSSFFIMCTSEFNRITETPISFQNRQNLNK